MELYVSHKGKYECVLIDSDDYGLVEGMTLSIRNGYLTITKMRNREVFKDYFHRVVMNAGDGMYVDHINHNILDNRKCNLRLVTRQQQQQNLRGMLQKEGRTSKYKGVCWSKNAKKWVAQCRDKNKKQTYLGLHDTEEKAARAYDAFAAVEHGEYAYLNFPDSR